ncbi:MAG: RIO1 family regulatory kinase/ATPase [Chloroflexota bacterium]
MNTNTTSLNNYQTDLYQVDLYADDTTFVNHNTYNDHFDEEAQTAYYEERFQLNGGERQPRHRKKKANHRPKKTQAQILQEIAETTGLERGFETTYSQTRYEETFLLNSVRLFYEEELISDILAQVKGGKEASVYRCEATPATGVKLLAAKVYRPRQFRNLRNDKMYREGRKLMSPTGGPVEKVDSRTRRALKNKSSYGAQVSHTSWLMHEFATLEKLYNAGAAVPKPYTASENAILMGYVGDAGVAAPTLQEVSMDRDEAHELFQEVIRNIELMLAFDLIHGDLSAFNILYWEGQITLIDFPQVVSTAGNPNARQILQRDVQRVCEYFENQGVLCDARALSNRLWYQHAKVGDRDRLADFSRATLEE